MAHYDGKPRYPMPARNFDIFISAFEKKVAEAQKLIKQTEQMQRPYNAVSEVLSKCQLIEDIKLTLDHRTINVVIVATEQSRLDDIDALAIEVGRALFTQQLHHDGKPSQDFNSYSRSKVWNFHLLTHGRVSMLAEVPAKGTADYIIETHTQTSTYEYYTLKPRKVVEDAKTVDIYTEIANEVGWTRDEVKEFLHFIAYDADIDLALNSIGKPINKESTMKAFLIKDLLAKWIERAQAKRVRNPD